MDRDLEISALIEDLGSLDSEERRRTALQLEVHGQAALHPLVDALQSTNPVLRMEAAQLIVRLVQRPEIPPTHFLKSEPESIPETIGGLVAALRNPSVSYREKVEERLLAHREAAIPALIQALPGASPIHASRIVQLLPRLQAVEAIPALTKHLSHDEQYPSDGAVVNTLNELIGLIPTNFESLGVDALVTLLKNSPYPHINSKELEDSVAIALGYAAQKAPVPQLREALPYLKRPWYRRPASFELARRFIEEATANWKDLPLPAQNSQVNSSLPRPAEPTENPSADLPQPAERV